MKKSRGFNYSQLMDIADIQEEMNTIDWSTPAGYQVELLILHLSEHIRLQEERIAELEGIAAQLIS